MQKIADRAARFMTKVDRTGACWLWLAETTATGYGRFWDGTRKVQAHRFAYEAFVTPIPEGLTIDHLCRVRNCVNPAHLEPVTQQENSLRAPASVNRIHADTTHCPQGHPYSLANTKVVDGKRYCRTCRRIRARDYGRRKRAEGHPILPSRGRM